MGLNQFKDDLGNTNYKSAIQYLLNQRAKLAKGKDRTAYDGELCQRPIFPSEVFLISEVIYFLQVCLKMYYLT